MPDIISIITNFWVLWWGTCCHGNHGARGGTRGLKLRFPLGVGEGKKEITRTDTGARASAFNCVGGARPSQPGTRVENKDELGAELVKTTHWLKLSSRALLMCDYARSTTRAPYAPASR